MSDHVSANQTMHSHETTSSFQISGNWHRPTKTHKHETKQLTENRDTKKQTCISDERPDFNSPTWNETFRIQHTRPKPEQLDGGTRYNLVR